MTEITVFDTVSADTLEVGDQIIVDGDPISITGISETDDPDEILVTGYSFNSGDTETYSLFADDYFDLWGV